MLTFISKYCNSAGLGLPNSLCMHFKALVLYILAVIVQKELASCVELGVVVSG